MGALTEVEIFDCLKDNFKSAIRHCEALATSPKKGTAYRALRTNLRLIEGACKQAAAWRQDTRWLRIAFMMGEAHKRAGDWLRGIKQPNGPRIPLAPGHRHPAFMGLAENMRKGLAIAEGYRTRATNHVGTVLPEPLPGPHRDTRPVHVSGFKARESGLLVPEHAA